VDQDLAKAALEAQVDQMDLVDLVDLMDQVMVAEILRKNLKKTNYSKKDIRF
jgi:hypothetical protein